MASWTLVRCLVRLRTDFDMVAESRDRQSDGTIGDKAHQMTNSDHNPDEVNDQLRSKDADSINEVHAIDVDADLRTPGLTMEMVVQHLLARCRSGAETRLRYIIFNRRIWEASNGWRQRAYIGPNPHDKHAHFSSSYETKLEASTASWRLEDIPVALTDSDKKFLTDLVKDLRDEVATLDEKVEALTKTGKLTGPDGKPDGTQTTPIGSAALSQGIPNPFNGGKRSPAWLVLQQTAEGVKGMTDGPTPPSV